MKNYGAFNLRHLAKGIKCINNLKPEELGITANQIKILKGWLKITGLSNGKKLTPLGILIKRYDRFLEEDITMQILHYNILTNDENSIWRCAFNVDEFNREYLISKLATNYDFKTDEIVADLNVLLNMYIPKMLEKENPNKLLLPLIKKYGDLYYKKEYKPNEWVALAIMIDNLPEINLENNAPCLSISSVKTEDIQFRNVFGLGDRKLEDILYKLQDMKLIKINKYNIEILSEYTFLDCIEKAYKELNENGKQ
ncbi:DUF4007 family protein [Veillonella sp.]|jgi:hypothetical protein|uniref:DUF4007 family protein n=1 Tax=Veillonella sp. TaxID=1926307 RepID=UPI00204785F7|nr:DUF4007 family protein [Veillonella sp.]DAT46063.1 MAG TPA: Protein of unknown function (DUF4007) [Caudoviricetes sp.]